jgi:hypothetical protein
MAARPLSTSWPLAGEAVVTNSESPVIRAKGDEEALSDAGSLKDVESPDRVVGTTELYENGQIRLIPVSERNGTHEATAC